MKPAATSPRVTRMAPSLSAADSPSRPPTTPPPPTAVSMASWASPPCCSACPPAATSITTPPPISAVPDREYPLARSDAADADVSDSGARVDGGHAVDHGIDLGKRHRAGNGHLAENADRVRRGLHRRLAGLGGDGAGGLKPPGAPGAN